MVGSVRKKLKNKSGASMLVALLFLAACVVAAAAIISAAASGAGKIRSNRQEHAKYLLLSSALQLVADAICDTEWNPAYVHTVTRSADIQVRKVRDQSGSNTPSMVRIEAIVTGNSYNHSYKQVRTQIPTKSGANIATRYDFTKREFLDIGSAASSDKTGQSRLESPYDSYGGSAYFVEALLGDHLDRAYYEHLEYARRNGTLADDMGYAKKFLSTGLSDEGKRAITDDTTEKSSAWGTGSVTYIGHDGKTGSVEPIWNGMSISDGFPVAIYKSEKVVGIPMADYSGPDEAAAPPKTSVIIDMNYESLPDSIKASLDLSDPEVELINKMQIQVDAWLVTWYDAVDGPAGTQDLGYDIMLEAKFIDAKVSESEIYAAPSDVAVQARLTAVRAKTASGVPKLSQVVLPMASDTTWVGYNGINVIVRDGSGNATAAKNDIVAKYGSLWVLQSDAAGILKSSTTVDENLTSTYGFGLYKVDLYSANILHREAPITWNISWIGKGEVTSE